MAITSAAKEIRFMRNILNELGLDRDTYGLLKADDQSAIKLAQNIGYSPRTKHIDVRHHYIRELVSNKKIKLEYVNTHDNLADVFTKALGPYEHIGRKW